MVLKNIKIIWFIIVILMALSCNDNQVPQVADEECDTYDYSDCNTIEPIQSSLKIDLTINDENPSPVLKIYEGFIEENNIIFADTMTSAHFELYLNLGKHYTAAIDYKNDGKIITAVDGTDFLAKSSQVCDSICWYVTGDELNLKLKL